MITIFVPVYNEEKILEQNLNVLAAFLRQELDDCTIIILDSNSDDRTPQIAKNLVTKCDRLRYTNIDSPGKGGKLKIATQEFQSTYYAFIDCDLPVGLEEFTAILDRVRSDQADLAIAFRRTSRRPRLRRVVSCVGHVILRALLGIHFKDVFAGAKAWNRDVADRVWPLVKDERWFFDVELIYHCKRLGHRITEIPVTYSDQRADGKFSVIKGTSYIGARLLQFLFRRRS